jgi:hyperosmotically inducible protein
MTTKNLSRLLCGLILMMGIQGATTALETNDLKDAAITTTIKAEMFGNKLIAPSDVKIKTDKGIVFISGNVKSHAVVEEAIAIVSSTEGILDINASDLQVQDSHQPISDAIITGKIKILYATEKAFGEKPIKVVNVHVTTKEGIVELTGEVDNKAQAENAKRLAEKVTGVRGVRSTLKVKD